ncbi:hypothetical protein CHS0354_014168 [Potamilus streckersoni]|uniref:C-type lectin domain-containing protein n=1 Tax=Potamilus streckersoni TaxID=2493646 RepID=A0AAE0SMC7_9BIVA|nr:hypothetical protein CHS0354_014168 [Potamilus streckersoni]
MKIFLASRSLTFVLEPTFAHGWISHGGKQYLAVSQPMNALDAETYCREQSAILARPTSANENAFIAGLLPGSTLWIDARKIGNEYTWSDGTTLTWYKWDIHQNFHDDCVKISGRDTDWLDVSCQGTSAFVCQKAGSISNTACPPAGHVHTVASAAEISSRQDMMQPGDTLQLADGIYHDLHIHLTKSGLAECGKKIYLRAKTPGKVILTGNTHIQYSGNYIDVEGMQITGHTSHPEVAVTFDKGTQRNRFAENAIVNFNPSNTPHKHVWVEIWGSHHIVERNAFVGKTYLGELLRVKGDASSTRESWGHRIAYNYFGPRSVSSNGGESIQIGLENHQHHLETVVEYNYFFRNLFNHSGDVETISIKVWFSYSELSWNFPQKAASFAADKVKQSKTMQLCQYKLLCLDKEDFWLPEQRHSNRNTA